MKTLYIFRRDLRLYDNKCLFEAYRSSKKIYPIYIFDENELREREIDLNHGQYRLILNVLKNINLKIRINVFFGDFKNILEDILSKYNLDSIFVCDSLSWKEELQNKILQKLSEEYKLKLFMINDNFLTNVKSFQKTNTFYKFFNSWIKRINSETYPIISSYEKFDELGEQTLEEFKKRYRLEKQNNKYEEQLTVNWLENRLKTFKFENYDKLRNLPYLDSSSKLSMFINIGAISIRKLYEITKNISKKFVRQLAWREYYYAIRFWYPSMKEQEVKEKMRNIEWENDKYLIESFIDGKTGYPIIDAGIRQLKEEGWIHNRIRLILANFLVKDLLVDWRIGEKLFSKYLIDYDEVLNVGNWQWSASVGIDPLPIRFFNPIIQAKVFDPKCEYIKKYLPELKDKRCEYLQDPIKYRIKDYIDPIVDHKTQIIKFKNLVRKHALV